MAPRFLPSAVRAARIACGISQREAGERVGVTPSTVKNIESGRHQPRAEIAAGLADVYGVPLDSLFHDEDATEPPNGRKQAEKTPAATASPAEESAVAAR